jgi:hypothetical protein
MAESTYLYVRRASVYSKEVAARRVTKSFSPNGSRARAQPPHITLAESERICSWCWFASTQKRVCIMRRWRRRQRRRANAPGSRLAAESQNPSNGIYSCAALHCRFALIEFRPSRVCVCKLDCHSRDAPDMRMHTTRYAKLTPNP